jgi:hypothetical protein
MKTYLPEIGRTIFQKATALPVVIAVLLVGLATPAFAPLQCIEFTSMKPKV